MINQFIFIFIVYYLIFIAHMLQHIHYYESAFLIHYPKLVSYLFKHSYTTLTLAELIRYFSLKKPTSHIGKLMNYQNLPEVFQHARTAGKNTQDYYHISDYQQGYDALSFNKNYFHRIKVEEQEASFIKFHEKKSVVGKALGNKGSTYNKIPSHFETYSLSNSNDPGVRPCPVDQLEYGAFSPADYEGLQTIMKDSDFDKLTKPSIIIEDYSDVYAKLVPHPKKSGVTEGTIINDSAFEELKWFYNYLENNEEMCLSMNALLEVNPFFPLVTGN